MELHFPFAPVFIPERQLLTVDFLHDGRRNRVALGNDVLTVLSGQPVRSEADQQGAFDHCRQQVEALVRQLLEQGRGARGLHITPEDLES
jgi:hypothetical protein